MRTNIIYAALFAALSSASSGANDGSDEECEVNTELVFDWDHVYFGQGAVPGPDNGIPWTAPAPNGMNSPPVQAISKGSDDNGNPWTKSVPSDRTITLTTTWTEPCSTGYTTMTTIVTTTHCGCTETPVPTISMKTVTITPSPGWPFSQPITCTIPVPPTTSGTFSSSNNGWGSRTGSPASGSTSSSAPPSSHGWPSSSSSNGQPVSTSTGATTVGSSSSSGWPTSSSVGSTTITSSTSSQSSSASTTSTSTSPLPTVSGARNVGYYVNWAIYARNFTVQDLQTQFLTHVLYAFAKVDPASGNVLLSDTWADTDKPWPGDDTSATGLNLFGNLKQLYLRKIQNRNLKTLLSIGGWTFSPSFATATSTEQGRQNFANSAVTLLQDLGFDGIDIDWEYPADATQAANFVSLLQTLRAALDASSTRNNQTRFLMSVAVSAGPDKYNVLDVPGMDASLDFWNLMAYDFIVSNSNVTAFQDNLYPSVNHPLSTPFNANDAVDAYLEKGVDRSRLVLGMPLYGRSFLNSTGPGSPCLPDPNGSWEPGVWDFKVLPKAGASEFFDPRAIASYSFDNATGNFITYDTFDTVRLYKAGYVLNKGLGGGMWWETSADRPIGQGSLIEAFLREFIPLDEVQIVENELSYPESKYVNLRAGMVSSD
ncbi:Chitinase 4 [Knufia peltigerae]|uniref:chitinase n=1 Tax=Knufia peltigerae TaxID=1002370 RepID=A0AA38Y9Y4_9EURO|nr:Chitinase 4 [Knufia peltigerae]